MKNKELSEILDLLNDIKRNVDNNAFFKIIREYERDGKCEQILDEFRYRHRIKVGKQNG